MWILGAVCWLPWFALALRFAIGLSLGDQSDYFQAAFMGIWPRLNMGLWPLYRLFLWRVVSWYPVSAWLGMLLAAVGWRIYWREQDGILTRPAWVVGLSIIVPPLAPFIMWLDARRRYARKEVELELEVVDARDRIGIG
jgi:hypothetical protein